MKKCILALVALTMMTTGQQAPRPAAPPGDLERAYRANNLGVARLEQFDYEGAAAAFRNALQLAPTLHMAQVNLAIALLYAGKPADAAPAARTGAAALPASATAHYVVGLIAKADNNLDEAAAAFRRVLEIDPTDAGARIQLGQVELQQRRYDEALRLFQDALAAEPYNVTAAYNVAIAFARAGRAEEGRPAMQRFETLRDSAYGVTYSQAYLGQGRYGEAIASTGAEPDLVDTSMPPVVFAPVDVVRPSADRAASTDLPGTVTLADVDGDRDLDLIDASASGLRLFQNARGAFADASRRAFPGAPGATAARGVVAGDYDNDGRTDLFVVRDGGPRLLHQDSNGVFHDATAAMPATPDARCAAWVDVDHDGDLDIVTVGRSVQVLRNNGDGAFTDISAEAGFGKAPATAVAIAPADFDNRRDVDLLLAGGTGAPALYRNMRDGSFRDAAAAAGLTSASNVASVALGDVNKDGYVDLFFGAADAPGTLASSDGRGAFRTSAAPEGTPHARASQFVDYDNDGLLDLIVMGQNSVRLFRNLGSGRWSDASVAAGLAGASPAGNSSFDAMAVGDVDGDGDADLILRDRTGLVRAWKNGGGRNRSLRVALSARVSNRSALGAKVELRAGSLRQMIATSSTAPAVAPADVIFGLGAQRAPDVVRVLWPSGILQAEIPPQAAATAPSRTFAVAELDRKPSSCPYLFTWNGTRFEFVTDFMGGGEIGDWIGPSSWNDPDPDEYVRIRGDQLQPRAGRYDLRITNELEEALFVDRMQLVAVDHPDVAAIYPNEGLRQAPRPPFALLQTRDARPPARARDEHGHDVLSLIASKDRRYADDFGLQPIRGYAAAHELTLDLGSIGDAPVLLLTGWTDYAFSSDNVAASQRRIDMAAPALDVRDASGAWRTIVEDMGFPVGRPQTLAVDLTGKLPSGSQEVRIRTNMRIYWDQIAVAQIDRGSQPRVTRIDPASAELRWRGFSREQSPDGREPFGYDYARVSTTSPWKSPAGRYTREGDVEPLLRRVDDMFVVSRPGDEIALSFDATALPALRPGWTRTFLLYAHGYSKEMNPRSARPDTVGPLPFRAMSGYPYGADERYPDTAAHREYQERYNTRVVNRAVPLIETAVRHE